MPIALKFLLKRIAAIFYDLILLLAVIMISTFCLVLCNKGQGFKPNNFFLQCFIFLNIYLFYIWFWCRNGQTAGLLAWKLKLISSKNNTTKITFKQANVRFFLAIIFNCLLGIGLIYSLFSKNHISLFDKFSGTKLINT